MAILTVGPGKTYSTFALANAAASNGDTIQIGAGTYNNDYANITANITVTGVGGRPLFLSTGNIPSDKAIWLVNATVNIDNIEFSGAAGASGNDEAIRLETGALTLTRCYIHNCQTGLLTGIAPTLLTVKCCEFANNGTGDGQTHNLYVAAMPAVVIKNCFFHDANVGHNIKSRALSTTITGCRIYDNSSTGSYSIDISIGGIADIESNIIQQGTNSQNPTIIAYAAEGSTNPSPSLTVNNNIIVNDLVGSPIGINNFSATTATVTNNQFYGLTSGQFVSGPATQSGSVTLGVRPTLDQSAPCAVSASPGTSIKSWRGATTGSFSGSAAGWLSTATPYETWLSRNQAAPFAVQIEQCTSFADTGDYTWAPFIVGTLLPNWIDACNTFSRPNLILRLGCPLVVHEKDWDNLLAGTAPTGSSVTYDFKWGQVNDYIVAHNSDPPGNNACRIRIRLGWEMNGDWEPWGPRTPPTWPASTWSKAKYRAGFRRVAGLLAGARALGTKVVWNPGIPHKQNHFWTPVHTAASLWPGDDDSGNAIPGFDLVDVIGGDCYDQFLGGPTVSAQQRWNAMYSGTGVGGEGLSTLLALATEQNLPVSFDEWGVDFNTGSAHPNAAGDDSFFIDQMSQVMQTLIDQGRFDGQSYWNLDSGGHFKVSTAVDAPVSQAEYLSIWGSPLNWAIYNRAKKKIFNGSVKLGVDAFKMLLVQSSSNFATLTLSTVASLTNQCASAGGYVQAGLPMVTSWSVGSSAGAYQFSMAPLIQTATGGGIVNIKACVVKNSAGQLLCFATITASQFAVPAGNTITVAPLSSGIFTLSSPISAVSIAPAAGGALALTGTQPVVTSSSSVNQLVQVRPMQNWGASATPANFYKEFAAHFGDGDVPQGSFVEWRLADGSTVIPSQGDNVARFPSGALQTASFTMRYPSAVAPSVPTTLKGYAKGGSFNNTSWTSSAIIGGRDLRLEVTVLTSLSQVIGTGNGSTTTFSATLAGAPLRAGTLAVNRTTIYVGDDGAGQWLTQYWSASVTGGSINYATGAVSVTFALAPTSGTPVTVAYAVASDVGTVYTMSANNEVTRGTNIRQVRSGPVSASWRIFGELRNGTLINSAPEGDLWGFLYVTFFSDNTYSVWGQVENARSTKSTATVKRCGGFKVRDYAGPTDLYSYTSGFRLIAATPIYGLNTDGLHPYSGTSVDKCVVGFPVLTLNDPTTRGLYDSACIHWQVSTAAMISDLTINSASTFSGPNSLADMDSNPNGTAGHLYVGPISSWACSAMLSQTWTALRMDRINALSWAPNQSSFLDATVGYPANLTQSTVYPGLGTANRNICWIDNSASTFTITGGNLTLWGNGDPNDGTHCGLYAWYQYLATGQEPWLDLLLNQCIGQLGYAPPTTVPSGRNPIINGTAYGPIYHLTNQTRGIAWNLRNLGNTEWVTPTNHPMKPYLQDIQTGQYAAMANYVQAPNSPAAMATLGIFVGSETLGIGGINSPWMHEFLLMSYAMQIRRGRIPLSHGFVNYHLIPWVLGRQINACAWPADAYVMGIGSGASPAPPVGPPWSASYPWPQTWSNVWYSSSAALPLAFPTVPGGPGGGACPASGMNVPNFSTGGGNSYNAISLASNSAAKIVGMATADQPYNYMQNYMLSVGLPEAGSGLAWSQPLNCMWRVNIPQ